MKKSTLLLTLAASFLLPLTAIHAAVYTVGSGSYEFTAEAP